MDKKELDKLIEEVLLQEFKVKIGDWETTGDKYKRGSIEDAGFDYSKVRRRRDIDKIKKMAKLAGGEDYLEPQDIAKAVTTPGLKIYGKDWADAAAGMPTPPPTTTTPPPTTTTPPPATTTPPPATTTPPPTTALTLAQILDDPGQKDAVVNKSLKDEVDTAEATSNVEKRLERLKDIINGYMVSKWRKANDPKLKILAKAFEGKHQYRDFLATMAHPVKAANVTIADFIDGSGNLKPRPKTLGNWDNIHTGQSITPVNPNDPKKSRPTGPEWDDVSNLSITKNRDLNNYFNAVKGKNYFDKFKSLEAFAKAANSANPVTELSAFKTAQGLNEADLLSYAFVLSMLADTAKKAETSNAGDFLEGFLSYLILQPSVGGHGKTAADNVGKLLEGGQVFSSAKFYAGFTAEQSTPILDKQIEAFGQIYYFVMVKSEGNVAGGGSVYDNLRLYVLKLTKDGDRLYATNLKPDLSKESTWRIWSAKDQEDVSKKRGRPDYLKIPSGTQREKITIPTHTALFKKYNGKFKEYGSKGRYISDTEDKYNLPAFATIKALPTSVKDNTKTFDEAFINAVTVSADNILPVVKGMTENIANIQSLEDESKSFVGVSTTAYKRDPADKVTKERLQQMIANEIGKLYGNIKKAFKMVFDADEMDHIKTPDELKESKSPLDQLIEAIVKEKLLK